MANKLVWGSDLYKGFKLDKNLLLNGAIDDLLPFQMLTLDQRTEDWIQAVADYYETAGWQNVERKAHKIQKKFWMRYGKLDQSDYIINPEFNPVSKAIGMIVPPETNSPLEQFYPILPNFVDILRGEFIKRDNTWTIETIDPYSINQSFQQKEEQFKSAVMELAMLEKQQTLAELGLSEESNPEEYQKQIQAYYQKLEKIETEARNFRTEGAKWAEKVIKIHEKRYNLHELEPDAFDIGLTTDSTFFHLDLLDDDFRLELLNPKWCDYHKGPNTKYVSQGDYFLWFDFGSAGDIINKYGRRMKESDILKLKEIYVKTANIIVPDYLKGRGDSYYDLSKPWAKATDLNPAMNDALLGKELAYSLTRSPNFDHNQDVDIFNPVWGRNITGHPQMFRIMNLYWRAMRRVGWLTKINKDGSRDEPTWIDETYKVTIDPVYDKSILKAETKDNLLYGEHIDWTWANEWRRVIKISPNQKHTFWLNNENELSSIYIGGEPVRFQFRGQSNPFDSEPPIEGCDYTYLNGENHGLVDRGTSLQILYNICMNKVPKKILTDYGLKLAIDKRMMQNHSLNNTTDGQDMVDAYEDKLSGSNILDYVLDRESLAAGGQPALPTVLNLSTVQDAQLYFQLAQQIKWETGELIGISRQRAGGVKASETATGIQQSISYSETQTEKYYEQHSNLMQRVRQKMLNATQYYSTFNESNRDIYMNSDRQNVFLEIEGMDNLLTHYNIYLESRANVRSALKQISEFLLSENTLPITPSAKIQAIVEQSMPKLMSLIKEGELEQVEREESQRSHELALEEERRKTLQMAQDFQKELQKQKDDAAYIRETDVAEIRSQAGIQTDVNANGVPDAADNLAMIMKQQEIERKNQSSNNAAAFKYKADAEKTQVQREGNILKYMGDKYKADKTLEVAKENKDNVPKKPKK